MTLEGDGNVGIGTTGPNNLLEISGIRENQIRLTSYDTTAAADEIIGGIEFYSSDAGNEGVKAKISAVSTDDTGSAYLSFFTGTGQEQMRISNAGSLKLDAYGAGTLVSDASGNITVSSGGGAGGPFLPLAGGTMTGTSGIEFPDSFKLKWKSVAHSTEVFSITSAGDTNSIVSGDGTNSVKTKFFVGDGGLALTSNDPVGAIADFGYGGTSLFQSNVEQLATTSSGIKVKGGDKGQPGYTFIGDTNTGMYSDTADQLDFATGGNIGMVIDSSSNVGIGTSSPAFKLDVSVSTAGDYAALINNTNSTNGYGLLARTASTGTSSYAFAARAGSSDIFVVRADGNVGIGTTSPGQKLDVSGNIASNSIYLYDSTSNDRLVLDLDGSDNLQISTGTSTGSRGITFFTESSEKMRILSGGNVGIGNTSPGNKLEVTGIIEATVGDTGGFAYGADPATKQGLMISVSNTGGDGFSGAGRIENTSTANSSSAVLVLRQTNSAQYSTITQFRQGSGTQGNLVGYVRVTTTNTIFSTTGSDERLKKNITNWTDDTLGKFKALQPKKFRYKNSRCFRRKNLRFYSAKRSSKLS